MVRRIPPAVVAPPRPPAPPTGPPPPTGPHLGALLLADLAIKGGEALAAVARAPDGLRGADTTAALAEIRAELFAHLPALLEVKHLLHDMERVNPNDAIEREQIAVMGEFLFSSLLAKQKRDADQIDGAMADLLDLFNPAYVGLDPKLFPQVPRHPCTVALALKLIKDNDAWLPTTKRLREALALAAGRALSARAQAESLLDHAHRIDRALFARDRAVWAGAYTSAEIVDVAVRLADDERDPPDYLEAIDALFNKFFDDYGNPRDDVPLIEAPKQRPKDMTSEFEREPVAARVR
jgi:hypothetical protein